MGFEQDILVTCRSCTSKVNLAEMYRDGSSENLVCKSCYKKMYYGKNNEGRLMQAGVPNKIHYQCLNCSYSFSRAPNFNLGGVCVNCGKQALQRKDTKEILAKDPNAFLEY